MPIWVFSPRMAFIYIIAHFIAHYYYIISTVSAPLILTATRLPNLLGQVSLFLDERRLPAIPPPAKLLRLVRASDISPISDIELASLRVKSIVATTRSSHIRAAISRDFQDARHLHATFYSTVLVYTVPSTYFHGLYFYLT